MEKTNSELVEKNKYYENLCLQLKKDIDLLKEKGSEQNPVNVITPGQSVTPSLSQRTSHSHAPSETYETDEEELNTEVGRFEPSESTNWKTVSNKKRTRESPENINLRQKQHKVSPYWLGRDDSSTNRFAPLQKEVEP